MRHICTSNASILRQKVARGWKILLTFFWQSGDRHLTKNSDDPNTLDKVIWLWQAQSYKVQLPTEMMIHPGLATCMSKVLNTAQAWGLNLVYGFWSRMRLLNWWVLSNIWISIVNIRLKYHLFMHLQGQMEVLPNVMGIQEKKCTLLYFRDIWIPAILKSKRYYNLLKKIRTIIVCHLLDCYLSQVWSWVAHQRKIGIHSLWKDGDFPQFNIVLNYLSPLVKQIINFAHWMKDWTPAMHTV